MKQVNRIILTTLLAGSVIALTACGGGVRKGKEVNYRAARTSAALQVPPDLSSLPANNALPGAGKRTALYSRHGHKGGVGAVKVVANKQLLPEFKGIKLRRNGNLRWLEVKAAPGDLWNKVRSFVLSMGLIIVKESVAAGIIETDWIVTRVNVGAKKRIRDFFKSTISTDTRDKFRFRLERTSEPGVTEIYISHRGMREVVTSDSSDDSISTKWQPRPADVSMEIEKMRLLMVYLGVGKQESKQIIARKEAPAERARMNKNNNGYALISLQDHLDRAWRRVGISIDRIGFTVEDRNRSRGIYYIRYIDPKYEGKKKRRKKKRDKEKEQYQISLKPLESGTQVAVLNKVGDPEKSKTSKRILGLLYEQLK
ncbi:MAG TPA: outer membrane protein assembly factor BamC [Acidiferrobacteraceae bacterium]|nr:outer membrane protein assembly factor BamC [Acidiferrobacteraceae bacterium]HEX20165.1 outer membrane protein assembly factor BamC [Acidiferrobacteraceae bacterium]